MHLGAVNKRISDINSDSLNFNISQKVKKIIAIFGGTNPGLYGYKDVVTLGKGRKDQGKLRPGFLKEGYDAKNRNYFDHISHKSLTAELLSSLY